MANQTSNLPQMASSQAGKDVLFNQLLDAASPGTYFGRNGPACVGFTWAYLGAVLMVSGVPTRIANGTLTLGASVTTYIEATTAGVVSANTSGWTSGRIPLYKVTTSATAVTNYEDWRCMSFAAMP